jgi:Ni/Fe-hydrogenase 1 B-type cytochrome subunit
VTNATTTTVARGEAPWVRQNKVGRRWVYLWHWPIRAMHWISTVCVTVLVVTGLFIGRPYFLTSTGNTPAFLMGWMRFFHFLAAAIFVATAMVRVYWLFIGNKFESFSSLIPWRTTQWKNMAKVLKKYLLIEPERAPHYLGHNPLQQATYSLLYLIAIVQIVTGFAMYGLSNPGGLIYTLFAWVVPFFGGAQIVRLLHHVLTWFFVIFLPVHIYFTVRADALHREGRISSMVSGGRFVRDDLPYVDEHKLEQPYEE